MIFHHFPPHLLSHFCQFAQQSKQTQTKGGTTKTQLPEQKPFPVHVHVTNFFTGNTFLPMVLPIYHWYGKTSKFSSLLEIELLGLATDRKHTILHNIQSLNLTAA